MKAKIKPNERRRLPVFCPLCGSYLELTEDEVYYRCYQCSFNEEFMPVEEEVQAQ